ncbi:hypothetical protein PAHA111176_23735 [Parendozoicomonas haliclonae]|uniref:Uncharacterized protein n=1 Tax=Parendozoicomonas haliclonae TaxID=1960125 RepID=A0A1X7ALK4_9GAMM|nr:hypothetical protein EHSB41UT_02965 [Parendozoicomonas haliclonae]
MIQFNRYPHVLDLLQHYATALQDQNILSILQSGVSNREDAFAFSKFVWRAVDQMADDSESGTVVLGRSDNSDTLPDIYYEVSLYMESKGFESIWEQVSDEA